MPPKVPIYTLPELVEKLKASKRSRDEYAEKYAESERQLTKSRAEVAKLQNQVGQSHIDQIELHKSNAILMKENASLTKSLTTLQKAFADLKAAQVARTSVPLRATTMRTAAASPVDSSSSPARKALSNESRDAFVSLYTFYRGEVKRRRAAFDGPLPPKGHPDRPPNYTDALEFIRSLNPQWACIDKLSFADQLVTDSKNGIERFSKKKGEGNVARDNEVALRVLTILSPLNEKGAIFSVRGAWEVVESKWPKSAVAPSMSTVFRIMKDACFKMVRMEGSAMDTPETNFRIERYQLEYAYLCVKHKIHPRLIVNIDESALRLVPTRQYSWCLEGTKNTGRVFDRFPLKRNYTTLTAGVSKLGKKLRLMVNWKGTDRLVVDGFPDIVQYCQPTTHWNTTESFLHYLEYVVLPFVKAEWESMSSAERQGYNSDFMIVIDCAPIHISLKTRERIAKLFDGEQQGHVVFLPPGCTAKSQPLDINCFGPVKSSARAAHLSLLTSTLEHRPQSARTKNLASTRETRRMALSAIQTGWERLKESTIANAWEVSLGRREGERSDVLESRLKDRHRRAVDRMAEELRAREAHQAVLARCEREKKKAPACPEASRWMFRFGLPGSAVESAEEATNDALLHADSVVRVEATDLRREVGPGMEDENDIQLPIEAVEIDFTGAIVGQECADSDEDIDDNPDPVGTDSRNANM